MQLLNSRPSRASCCGCLTLALLVLIILCVLSVVGILALTRTADASSGGGLRHVVLLVDHSNSIAYSPRTRTLAQAAAQAFIANLQTASQAGDSLSVFFFGSRAQPVMTGTLLSDDSITPRLNTAFALARPLGGTDLIRTLSTTLRLNDPATATGTPHITDVILVSDGVPDPLVSSLHAAYRQRLREVAAEYAKRSITLSVLLIRSAAGSAWRATWADVATRTHGQFAEADAAVDRQAAALAAEIASSLLSAATATATPTTSPMPSTTAPATSTAAEVATATTTTTPTPRLVGSAVGLPAQDVQTSPTPEPTTTPLPAAHSLPPAAVVVSDVAAAPIKPASPAVEIAAAATSEAAPIPAWLIVAAAALVLVGVLAVARRRRMHARARRMPSFPADEGVLEIYDPETDEVERVELRTMEPGEVWLMGSGPQCPIHLQCAPTNAKEDVTAGPSSSAYPGEREFAALVLGHDGPRVESRGAPLYYEGRRVLSHRMYDGDHLYLDRFVLYYHNFFRQRPMVDEDDGRQTANDSGLRTQD